jgi:ADP-heptose:LPS heptosyltransferase
MSTTNIVDTTLALMKREGDDGLIKFIPVSEVNRNWAALRFPARGKVRIAMFFGSRQSADVWPEEYAQELINLVLEEFADTEILLIGGPEQKGLTTRLMESVSGGRKQQISDLAGLADLNQTAALMARCHLVISTDSGPMHIADAQKVPIVALFSAKKLCRCVEAGAKSVADPTTKSCLWPLFPGGLPA